MRAHYLVEDKFAEVDLRSNYWLYILFALFLLGLLRLLLLGSLSLLSYLFRLDTLWRHAIDDI